MTSRLSLISKSRATSPLELRLELRPRDRVDVIDVARLIRDRLGDVLEGYRKVLYCSHHTTAGFLNQGLARRLADQGRIEPFLGLFQQLFPYGAGYLHDSMELRQELTDSERLKEPPNADAHLTFIGSGLQSCVTYDNHDPAENGSHVARAARPGTRSSRSPAPVLLVDLDGVYQGRFRSRTASVVAYTRDEVAHEETWHVPISRHGVDSINLSDHRLGLMDRVRRSLEGSPITHGCLDISLDGEETAAAVTVNEYETLLMRHDLAEVLRDPLRFMANQGRRMLSDPKAVAAKSIGYAKYDVVRVMNELLDALGLAESAVERVLTRLMAFPASRLLRLKRSLHLPLTTGPDGEARLVAGRYQSPILIQWAPPRADYRKLRVKVRRFE